MPIQSPYPPLDIPDVDLWTFLFERKDRPYPEDKVIYHDAPTSRTSTYADTLLTAQTFGLGLRAHFSWPKGGVLALYTPNCIDTPAVTWGCHWAGGVLSPANPAYTVDELAFQLRDSGALALVTQLQCLDNAKEAARRVGIPEERILLMGDERDPAGRVKHFTSIANTSGTQRFRRVKINPRTDLAFLVYSSGTTGRPKGVMLSHRNVVANILMLAAGEGGNLDWRRDVTVGFLPFYHIYGLNCLIHQSLYQGLTLVVMPRFDLETFCRLIQTQRITFAYVVPPVVLQLGKHPVVDKYDLSSLRMLNSGAAPLTRELVMAVWDRLKVPIKQGYGLSETSPTTHTQPWDQWHSTLGAIGTLLPNQTAKFVDPSSSPTTSSSSSSSSSSPSEPAELPPSTTGELCVRGPNIFQGYHHNASLTTASFTPEGYFRTGDIGHYDPSTKAFYITDRAKELIKYKGFQVAPAELEGLLITHEKVADAAVVGVYDAGRASEVPRGFVVLKGSWRSKGEDDEGRRRLADEIVEWVRGRVAPHKQLRGGVCFVDEIPRSAAGKVLRRVLRDQVRDAVEETSGVKAKL
ncbi:MAG: hypothetical protein M1817_001785 [Caeruleum heppii]|nr:MAG: hypothetical protein M1817_001785 [Caeruleum heppii]